MKVTQKTFEMVARMQTALKKMAIVGVLFFGGVFTGTARAQEANDPSQLSDEIADSEDDAISAGEEDLDSLANRAENTVKNEFQKDVALVESAIRTPTPTPTPALSATPTPDNSLKEIESEVDSLEAQSQVLSK